MLLYYIICYNIVQGPKEGGWNTGQHEGLNRGRSVQLYIYIYIYTHNIGCFKGN